MKYPYNPFYGEFSPRIARLGTRTSTGFMFGKIFGHDSTVIRGGYSRIYGRLNGVDLVLVPLLGTGLIQPVQCVAAYHRLRRAAAVLDSDHCFPHRGRRPCGPASRPPAPTLPQPDFPGINDVSAGAGEALDPNFRPNVVDSFDLHHPAPVVAATSRWNWVYRSQDHHEYQPINVNAVPYMMTMGGQRFDKAYANGDAILRRHTRPGRCGNCAGNAAAVTPQPFFETALAGTGLLHRVRQLHPGRGRQ